MKKLLIFALIIGLFAGCKKTEETPAAPCYVGTWEGSMLNADDVSFAAFYYNGPPTITLYSNNTGVARYLIKSTATSPYAGNKVGVGFTYTVSTDNAFSVTSIISSTLTIGSGEPVTQDKSTSEGLGYFLLRGSRFYLTCQSSKLNFNPDNSYSSIKYTNIGILMYYEWTRKQ